jgi:hypothetical protein
MANALVCVSTCCYHSDLSAILSPSPVNSYLCTAVECPADQDLTPSDSLSTVAYWNEPRPGYMGYFVSVSSNHASGSTFYVGTTTVTYSASATTTRGRVSAQCSFTITVHGASPSSRPLHPDPSFRAPVQVLTAQIPATMSIAAMAARNAPRPLDATWASVSPCPPLTAPRAEGAYACKASARTHATACPAPAPAPAWRASARLWAPALSAWSSPSPTASTVSAPRLPARPPARRSRCPASSTRRPLSPALRAAVCATPR